MTTPPGSDAHRTGWALPPLLHPPHTRPCPPPPGRAPGQALTGLVLGGGGARAAYQVGVLRALARLQRQALGPCLPLRNPFDVVVGTSAGAINAAALACRADQYEAAVQSLVDVWWHFQSHQVYRADAWGVVRTGTRWLTMLSLGWALRRWRRLGPQSLLDNAPLAELLDSLVPMDRLPGQLAAGHLKALAITASRYSTGEHVSFYSAAQAVRPWARSQRLALPAHLGRSHLMASSATPSSFRPGKSVTPGRAAGMAMARCARPRRCRRPSTWAPSGCWSSAWAAWPSRPRAPTPRKSARPAWPRWAGMRCPASSWTRWRWTWSACTGSTAPWPCCLRPSAGRPTSSRSRPW